MLSSNSCEWATPIHLFDSLNAHCHFNLDPCATIDNHKCERFFTIQDDGLAQNWSGQRIFMNPPYGRTISLWMHKLSHCHDALFRVALVPARCDTKWFFDFVWYSAYALIFIKGRLKFNNLPGSATFSSVLVFYDYDPNIDLNVFSDLGKLIILKPH